MLRRPRPIRGVLPQREGEEFRNKRCSALTG